MRTANYIAIFMILLCVNIFTAEAPISYLSYGKTSTLAELQQEFKQRAVANGTSLEVCGVEYPFIYIIPPLSSAAFRSLPNLKALTLYFVDLGGLEHRLFEHITGLEDLHLKGSFIKDIRPGAFMDLNNLKKLSIENNLLSHLEPGVFNGLANLEYLNLSNNKLKKIDLNIFNDVPLLRYLALKNNAMCAWYKIGLRRRLKKRLPNTTIEL